MRTQRLAHHQEAAVVSLIRAASSATTPVYREKRWSRCSVSDVPVSEKDCRATQEMGGVCSVEVRNTLLSPTCSRRPMAAMKGQNLKDLKRNSRQLTRLRSSRSTQMVDFWKHFVPDES